MTEATPRPDEVMIDLETFGLPPDGMIISIGAVKFAQGSDKIVDRFHVCLDPEATTKMILDHFTINASTVKWWMHPDRDEARIDWHRSYKFDMPTALAAFLQWYGSKSLPTWGNGVTFDVTLMKHALDVCSLPTPWKFYDERCHRTLKSICPPSVAKEGLHRGKSLAASGVAHNALYDAEVQAIQNLYIRHNMIVD